MVCFTKSVFKAALLERCMKYQMLLNCYQMSTKGGGKEPLQPQEQKEEDDEKPNMFLEMLKPVSRKSGDVVSFISKKFDFSPSAIRQQYNKMKTRVRAGDQSYNVERHQVLGPNLAAAHFIVYRGGAVRFHGHKQWIRSNEDDEYNLPDRYISDMILEGLDASNTELTYIGFDNLVKLDGLRWLSLRNCLYIDDFCLDRLGMFSESLEYLDISQCPQVTERGVSVLHRLRKLKVLKMEDMSGAKHLELVCILLEDALPDLQIYGVKRTVTDPRGDQGTDTSSGGGLSTDTSTGVRKEASPGPRT